MSVFFKNKILAMGAKKDVMVAALRTALLLISFFIFLLDMAADPHVEAVSDTDDADPHAEAVSDTDDASANQLSSSSGQYVEATSSPKST